MSKIIPGVPSEAEWLAKRAAKAQKLTATQELIAEVCDEIKELLITKNRKYGNSALNPIRIFSNGNAIEQINVRIDDKLNRKMNQQSDEDEDIDLDLIGYLVLKRVWVKLNASIQADDFSKADPESSS